MMATGAITTVATSMRPAAITTEGASTWAKRINNEAVETARIPTARIMIGGNDRLDEGEVVSAM